MTSYVKSLSSDFGGNLNPTQLQTEINDHLSIDPICIVVTNRNGDNVKIVFDSSLSSGEETTLDSIISSHNLTTPLKSSFYKVTPILKKTNNTTYRTIATTTYDGSKIIGSIDAINITSKMDMSLTNYQIRVIDRSNGNLIVSQSTLTNTDLQIINLGSITNIPEDETILEVQGKCNGNIGSIYLDEIIIYYDN